MTFELIAGNLALDFANTVHIHGFADPQDDLQTFTDLSTWGRQAGLWNERESRQLQRQSRMNPASADADFRRFLRLREVVYELFSSLTREAKVRPRSLTAFNAYLKQAMVQPSVLGVGGHYQLKWQDGTNAVARGLGEITRSATGLLTSKKLDRVRQCAGESCTWLFLDTSRNGMRRWCDMQACGNRVKVRRFRQRVQLTK
jgi:predicted RNA-binding Zn ribbon-like protein